MVLPDPQQIEQRLRRLERQNNTMWTLAGVLMIALAVAVAWLQMARATPLAGEGETGYVLVVGLSGLVVLFSLYMMLKQRQMHHLRVQLMRSAMREEATRSHLTSLATLFEGLARVGVQFDLVAVLQEVAEQIRESLGADQASILLTEEDESVLRSIASAGQDAAFVRGATVPMGGGIAGWVAAHNEPLVVTPEEVARRFPDSVKPGRSIAAGLCVPLALPDRVIGVLTLNRLQPGQSFTEDDARLLTVFAAHIAIAIRRVQEREREQRELAEQEARLRETQKMEALGRLAGSVAHDFNNVLTVILACAAKLARGIPAGDPLRRNAERISEASERCVALTRQLVAFSRTQILDVRVLDLNGCVTASSELLRRLLGEGVELVTALEPQLGRVRVDAGQIEQMLVNLAANARDAMPGGGRMTIETRNIEVDGVEAAMRQIQPGSYVCLVVRDTGRGMDRETRERAFEPFFSTSGRRAGLGLATVQGAVEQAGGFITIDTEPRQGTSFLIHLPRVDAIAALAANAEAETRIPGFDRPGTLLVVEDESEVRELVREALQRHGYSVIEARWAGEAVMLADAHLGPIDLMITDVVMPGESGGELARWMAEARPAMPVLYMSGYTGDELVRHGITQAGATFLAKPFTEEGLIARVRAMLARPVVEPAGARAA